MGCGLSYSGTLSIKAFFGIFAINPTLTTIIELQKQVKDSEFVFEQLNAKVGSLSQLQQHYAQINSDLPMIYEAIPQNIDAALLAGQIEALAKQNKVTLTDLRVPQVELSGKDSKDTQGSSFTFALEADGSYQQLSTFANDIAHFNRLVTIESLTLQKPSGNNLVLQLQARAYFKK
jgi:Tfp pilus assembly protein PilO